MLPAAKSTALEQAHWSLDSALASPSRYPSSFLASVAGQVDETHVGSIAAD
jgi:hypothetical protein